MTSGPGILRGRQTLFPLDGYLLAMGGVWIAPLVVEMLAKLTVQTRLLTSGSAGVKLFAASAAVLWVIGVGMALMTVALVAFLAVRVRRASQEGRSLWQVMAWGYARCIPAWIGLGLALRVNDAASGRPLLAANAAWGVLLVAYAAWLLRRDRASPTSAPAARPD